jgi:hypothetical protein
MRLQWSHLVTIKTDVAISLGKEDRTDKTRHPHVIRTWRVERTKVLYRPPRPVKLPSHPVFSRSRRTEPVPTPRNAPPKAAS